MLKYYKYKFLKTLGLMTHDNYAKKTAKYTREYKAIARSKYFDKKWYLKQNPDVARAKVDPVQHYLTKGWKEGRIPSVKFNGNAYLEINLDVKLANINPLLNYEVYGKKDGRSWILAPEPVFPKGAEACIWAQSTKFLSKKKRLAIFASYTNDGKISDAVIYYLKGLKEVVDNIIFVADNPIFKEELDKIKDLVCYAQFERHQEYDFGSYKRGYLYAKENALLEDVDELVICNDSCYGPVYPFSLMFDKMKSEPCAFWGFAINKTFKKHIQSFFYVLKKQVFESQAFDSFLNSVKKEMHYSHVIINYEIEFSDVLCREGFSFSSFIPETYSDSVGNTTCYPNTLLEKYKAPLVKVKCFSRIEFIRENISIDSLLAKLYDINFDLASIIANIFKLKPRSK